MPLKRRDFLKIAGGASLGFATASCSLESLSESTLQSRWFSPVENWIPTVCRGCEGGCGIMVRVLDGRAVKITGNPIHPLNKGKVCVKGQAMLQHLYNPARLKGPIKRTGARGAGEWKSISWEEALDIVSTRLRELRSAGKASTVVYAGPDSGDTSSVLVSRFLQSYGTPNRLHLDDWITPKAVFLQTHGIFDLLAWDFENCEYILSFGADFLNNWPTALSNQRIYGAKREHQDVKIVQIEPRFSSSASRADTWIPITPGTEGLLALAMAAVIIKEKLYNRSFVDMNSQGFEDFFEKDGSRVTGFKNFVIQNINLDQVSDVTGVPLQTIIETAKEFATAGSALAVFDRVMSYQEDGTFNSLAVHSLNALVGNIDTPGGILRQNKAALAALPPLELDKTAKRSLSRPVITEDPGESPGSGKGALEKFKKSLKSKKPYEINCLILASRHPFNHLPAGKALRDDLSRIPFIVSFSPVMEEASCIADIILPDTSFLEKWHDSQASSLLMFPIVGVGRPVVKPRHGSRPFEDVILSLAKRLDTASSRNFPWENFKALLLQRLGGLFTNARGGVFQTSFEETHLKLLEERGWWEPHHTSVTSFMKDLLEKGGWFDPAFLSRQQSFIFRTSSRRFMFPTTDLLGHRSPDNQNTGDFPCTVFIYDLPFTFSNREENLPWQQETLGFRHKLEWKLWVEINPDTADKFHIKEGQLIVVESLNGKIKAVAKIFPGIVRDIVGIPLGKEENPPSSKFGESLQNNPLTLLADPGKRRAGLYSRITERVRIRPVRKGE